LLLDNREAPVTGPRPRVALAAALAVVTLAGCGGATETAAEPPADQATVTRTAEPEADGAGVPEEPATPRETVSQEVVEGPEAPAEPPAPSDGLVVAEPDTALLTDPNAQAFCPHGTHEGCHTYEEMQIYIDQMIGLIAPTFDRLYGVENRPSMLWYVAAGITGQTACVDTYDSKIYAYCPADRSIYVGQDMLWELYSGLGDAAPAAGFAHEWGHHVQTLMGVPPARTPAETIPRENQADCIAGAWVYEAETNGFMEYPDDLADLEALVIAIAGAEGDPERAHGTVEERAASLEYGYNYGLIGCNEFFPDTPVYVQQ
jgi:hypothetical protein